MGDTAVSQPKEVKSNKPITVDKIYTSNKSKTKVQFKGKIISKNYDTNPRDENNNLKNNIYVVFIECETPGNIGFLARTMANFGLEKLVLINPPKLKEEAFYQAMHGRYIVENAMVYDTLESFYKSNRIDFKVASTGVAGGSYNLSRIPIRPEELAEKINPNYNTAILFGREGDGLSNKEIGSCDLTVSIPTNPEYPILNISHAAAIILYEIFKNVYDYPVKGLEESTELEKEYLVGDMWELIDSLDIPLHKKRNGLKSFKNIINRAFITGREAHTLKGILRRLKMKIKEE